MLHKSRLREGEVEESQRQHWSWVGDSSSDTNFISSAVTYSGPALTFQRLSAHDEIHILSNLVAFRHD